MRLTSSSAEHLGTQDRRHSAHITRMLVYGVIAQVNLRTSDQPAYPCSLISLRCLHEKKNFLSLAAYSASSEESNETC